MNVEPLAPVPPALDTFMLVGDVVVADDMNLLAGRHGLVNQAQKLQPLPMPAPLLAYAPDLSAGGIERGKQCGGAVALVVVGHGLVATFFHGQAGLGAIQSLNLALLIQRQHQCVASDGEVCVVRAMIWLTLAAVIFGGRPGRRASCSNPVTPRARNRLRQRAAMRGATDRRSAIRLSGNPSAHSRTMRQRSITRTGVVLRHRIRCNLACVSSSRSISAATRISVTSTVAEMTYAR